MSTTTPTESINVWSDIFNDPIKLIMTIQSNSIRIAPDTLSWGMPICKGDVMWKWIKNVVREYGLPESRHEQAITVDKGNWLNGYGLSARKISILIYPRSNNYHHVDLMDCWILYYVTTPNHSKWSGYVSVGLI